MTPSETRRTPGRALVFVLALVLAFLGPGCITEPDTVDNDTTNVLVQVTNVSGEPGGGPAAGDDLFSDVCIQAVDDLACTLVNDNAVISLFAIAKDQTQLSARINDVIFERYRVTYVRADGRNVPGVDVPYPFDGATNFRVGIEEVSTRTLMVVRQQAKAESPLREIRSNLGAILSVIARIDLYGRDTAGRATQVTAYLNITFADFGNE